MNTVSASKTWDQFVSGDQESFATLFKSSYQGLYGYGLKLCNDPELVKDAIQNLFITVWERRDELTHINSPNVYLYVSLRRNILRSKKKQTQMINIKEEMQNEFQIHFGSDELIINKELRQEQKEKLKEALKHLSNKQKEVLYLHYYNGMSYGEIEEILSINRQSVRNHMYRAMETLRSVLDNVIIRLVITLLFSVLFL